MYLHRILLWNIIIVKNIKHLIKRDINFSHFTHFTLSEIIYIHHIINYYSRNFYS